MNKRKYYYSVLFDGGITYMKAVSKQAAIRQIHRAALSNPYNYKLETLKCISVKEYKEVHYKQ